MSLGPNITVVTTPQDSALRPAVWAWRARRPERGYEAMALLLEHADLTGEIRAAALGNLSWFAPNLAELFSSVSFAALVKPPGVRGSWFNPSIATSPDGGTLISVRSANYEIGHEGRYTIDDPDRIVRSQCYIAELNTDLKLEDVRMVREVPGTTTFPFPVRGYEDPRLFYVDDELFATATVRDRNAGGICHVALLRLDPSGQVKQEHVLEGLSPGRYEKNWTVLDSKTRLGQQARDRGTIAMVYTWDPLVIIEVDPDSGTVTTVVAGVATGLGLSARGGSGGVAVADGVLSIIHEQAMLGNGALRYLHRFVFLDERTLRVTASKRFCLLERSVEFAAGLVARDQDIWITFGTNDACSWLAKLSRREILQSLGIEGKVSVSPTPRSADDHP